MIETCVQKYGRIDIAFNNAGIANPLKELHEVSLEEFLNTLRTNTVGEFLAIKYEIPLLSVNIC